MKAKDDMFVFCEQRIVIFIAQPVRMFSAGWSFIRSTTLTTRIFRSGRCCAQNGNCGQNLQRGRVAAAGHDHIRFGVLVIAGPLPDANSFGAMHDRRVHGQPLREGVFACDHHVDIMPAAQAVIKNREQTIGIRRKVNTHNVRFLVDNVVEKTRVLMRKAVVILLPDMRGEQIIQARRFSDATAVPALPSATWRAG